MLDNPGGFLLQNIQTRFLSRTRLDPGRGVRSIHLPVELLLLHLQLTVQPPLLLLPDLLLLDVVVAGDEVS